MSYYEGLRDQKLRDHPSFWGVGAIGALMNIVPQPRPLFVLGLNVWMGTDAGADELVEIPTDAERPHRIGIRALPPYSIGDPAGLSREFNRPVCRDPGSGGTPTFWKDLGREVRRRPVGAGGLFSQLPLHAITHAQPHV